MSISSKLTALQADITDARTAIVNKGGTITSGGGSSQLDTDILTIPTGGGFFPSVFIYGQGLTSAGSVTLVGQGHTYNGVWSTKTISGVSTQGFLVDEIATLGSYTYTAIEDATVTGTILVDAVTDYDVQVTMSRLPSAYQELSYIESTGTQYVVDNIDFISSGKYEYKIYGLSKNVRICGFNILGSEVYGIPSNVNYITDAGYIGYNYSSWVDSSVSAFGQEHDIEYEFSNGSQSLYMDNSLIITTSQSRANNYNNFYLFITNPGMTSFYQPLRLYYFKLYNGSALVRDYVPCYRKSDGEVGLYDTVTSTFFTNQGTGSFRMGGVIDSTFNASYQQVEYLESSGTQYINTNLITNNHDITVDFAMTSSSNDKSVIGGCTTGTIVGVSLTYYSLKWYVNNSGSEQSSYSPPISITNRQTAILEYKGNLIIDGNVVGAIGNSNNPCTQSLYVFARNRDGYIETISSMRLYMLSIYDTAQLLLSRMLIPCYRISDSVAGMYDMVNGVFYTNNGTGTFTVGSDIDV